MTAQGAFQSERLVQTIPSLESRIDYKTEMKARRCWVGLCFLNGEFSCVCGSSYVLTKLALTPRVEVSKYVCGTERDV